MIYNIIALSIIGLFLGIIIFILVRKGPKLKTMDVDTIAEEKESRVKERILIDRLKRKAQKSTKAVQKVVGPSSNKLKKLFGGLYNKVMALEKKYQKESARKPQVHSPAFEEKVKGMILEAEELLKKEDYVATEKKYIEAISFDTQNKKAYQGLSHLYILQKEYQQAMQTAKYVLKIDLKKSKPIIKDNEQGQKIRVNSNAEEIAEDYIKLGEIAQAMGETPRALQHFQRALEQSSNDPKALDLLIETCIIIKDKNLAIDYFNRLAGVNPDNQKLVEYKKRLELM